MTGSKGTESAPAEAQAQALSREFAAPAARVFHAHTDPRLLRKWLPPQGSKLQISDFVARTGGLWKYTIAGQGGDRELFGSFHEITETTEPQYAARIVRTVESKDCPGQPRLEELRFSNLAAGCSRLEVLSVSAPVADGNAAAAPSDAEGQGYDRLDELLASSEWGAEARLHGETSNHRPGEPLRAWDAVTASGDLELTIQGSNSGESLVRLIDGNPLSAQDLIAFGRLNSLCVLKWFEPLVMLLGPSGPQLAPDHVALIRQHTQLFR